MPAKYPGTEMKKRVSRIASLPREIEAVDQLDPCTVCSAQIIRRFYQKFLVTFRDSMFISKIHQSSVSIFFLDCERT
jgi:hypothetical protein